MKERIRTCALVLMMFLAGPQVSAVLADGGPEADFSMSLLSQYIWRGYELSKDSMVVQPSATVSWGGASFNLWGNWDTDLYDGRPANLEGMDNYNETDITFSYSKDFGLVSAGVGYVYYALDQAEDSQEFFLTGSLNVFLSPTLTVCREFAHYPSTYVELAVSHSFVLPRQISLGVGLSGSCLFSDDNGAYADPDDPGEDYNGLHDGRLSISLTVPFTAFYDAESVRYFAFTPELYYVFPLGGDASKDMAGAALGDSGNNNFVYGGITFSLCF